MDTIWLNISVIVGIIVSVAFYFRFCLRKRTQFKILTDEEKREALFYENELERYLDAPKTNMEVGLMYERFIGFILDQQGYKVQFNGAQKGFRDQGRDLIATKKRHTLIVQTKFWSKKMVIGEKHIYQLHGTTEHFKKTHREKNVSGHLYSTTSFTTIAVEAAEQLGIQLFTIPYDRFYPMIKCHTGPDGIPQFYLPTDETYDRISMKSKRENFYTRSVEEAMSKGYRRVPSSGRYRSA